MKQAIHIFRKDSWHLRYVIAVPLVWNVLLALAAPATPFDVALFGLSNRAYAIVGLSWYVLPALWCYLIARICHAEALPGDRQFWLTRPYSRWSLLLAKALFVGSWVLVPFGVAQGVRIALHGVSLIDSLPGLVWEQVLIALVLILPAAAIASLTSSLVQFIPAIFVVPVLIVASTEYEPWGASGWVRYSAALTIALIVSLAAIVGQFMYRRTPRARLLALTGLLVLTACVAFLPWRPAFAFQRSLRSHGDDVVALLRTPGARPERSPNFRGVVQIHFDITGVGAGAPIACDAGSITVTRQNGSAWKSRSVNITGNTSLTPVDNGCSLWIPVGTLLDELENQTADLEATIFLTTFGVARTTSVAVGAPPIAVAGAGRCMAANSPTIDPPAPMYTYVTCDSPFRQPAQLLQFTTPDGQYDVNRRSSYSPFPAGLTVDPISVTRTTLRRTDRVDVTTRSIAAHVVRTVSVKNVRLSDFEVRLGR